MPPAPLYLRTLWRYTNAVIIIIIIIIIIPGMGFYESNDPTNSVKAQKKDRVIRIRLQSHQVHPIMLQ